MSAKIVANIIGGEDMKVIRQFATRVDGVECKADEAWINLSLNLRGLLYDLAKADEVIMKAIDEGECFIALSKNGNYCFIKPAIEKNESQRDTWSYLDLWCEHEETKTDAAFRAIVAFAQSSNVSTLSKNEENYFSFEVESLCEKIDSETEMEVSDCNEAHDGIEEVQHESFGDYRAVCCPYALSLKLVPDLSNVQHAESSSDNSRINKKSSNNSSSSVTTVKVGSFSFEVNKLSTFVIPLVAVSIGAVVAFTNYPKLAARVTHNSNKPSSGPSDSDATQNHQAASADNASPKIEPKKAEKPKSNDAPKSADGPKQAPSMVKEKGTPQTSSNPPVRPVSQVSPQLPDSNDSAPNRNSLEGNEKGESLSATPRLEQR